ncbi:Alpha/Beta hydrolase protein [Microdochium bolleyi]|uniref:Alpha/Beta hydrolase protein n=1 Tax=Microdochium bolleyi TaxID=196109 RepID=A0A136IV96_9PEZI|nr:Alpha/Beta hydrolase protein [Microdochium bolleyi]
MDTPKGIEDSITLPDGRILAFKIWGDPAATANSTAFYFHGFPGSRNEGLILHDAAVRHAMRIIAIDRPGMGKSWPVRPEAASRTLLDWPLDVLALADHLELERFGVIGVSGGAPYALATWHHDRTLRARCAGVCVVSGLWPQHLTARCRTFYALRAHWTFKIAGMWPRLTEIMFGLGVGAAAREACLTGDTRRLDKMMDLMLLMLPRADSEVLRANEGHARDAIRATMSEAFRQGSRGTAVEAEVLCGNDWGFRLEDVDVPEGKVVVWHGGEDVNVPLEMATVSVPHLKGVDFRVLEEEGHVSLIVHKADEIVDVMKSMLEGKTQDEEDY